MSAMLTTADFRKELLKLMPGYQWTVHQSRVAGYLDATGTQSSGFNRLSTLMVIRRAPGGDVVGVEAVYYEVKSSGYGTRAPWLHTNKDGTLARALRGLQQHYEAMAASYRGHAASLQAARATPTPSGANHA